MSKVILITGGTSGIGKTAAELFIASGWRVYELSRRDQGTVPGVRHLSADLSDPTTLAAALTQLRAETGRLDALVNNAGCGIFGAAISTTETELRRQFEVNFFGTVALTRLVLPLMQQQSGGNLINVASLAAFLPLPYQSFYSATKAALVAWSRALAGEVRADGIRVCCICPGDVRTGFTAARKASPNSAREANALAKAEHSEQNGQSPLIVAREIVRFAAAKNPPLIAIPGCGYAWLDRLSRLLPRTWVSHLIEHFYC